MHAPQDPRARDEPHQHREIDVSHQRDPEEFLAGHQVLDDRGARQREQQGKKPGRDQGVYAQPDPAERETRGLCFVSGRAALGLVHNRDSSMTAHSSSNRVMASSMVSVLALLAKVARTRPTRSIR